LKFCGFDGAVHSPPSLRVTPAMAAGVSKTLWTMDDLVKIVEEWEAGRDGSGTLQEAGG
jgi:hypothetical protein